MEEGTLTIQEKVLFDVEEARTRIEKNGKIYGILELSDLLLNENDFKLAEKMSEKEANIVFNGSKKLTSEGVFHGLIYCLLTPLQNYSGQTRGFESLLKEYVSTPAEIQEDNGKLSEVLKEKGILFHQQKASYIRELAQNWENLNLLDRIGGGIKTNRYQEVQLRQSISNEIKGLGEKTSSLFLRMCGAEYLVPIDSWMTEMIYFHGYPCKMPRSKVNRIRWGTKDVLSPKQRKRGLKGRKYLQAEEFTSDLAQKYEVPGYLLQLAFWTKKSTYQK